MRGTADPTAHPAVSSTDVTAPPCRTVLVIGHGRSGTNWLLKTLDLSRQTHCRNEADKLEGSAFHAVPSPRVVTNKVDRDESWDHAVAWAASRWGQRDHLVQGRKHHLYPLAQRLGLYRMVAGNRCRSVLRTVVPALDNAEYGMPPWVVNRQALARARCVLKLNQVPGWAAWVLRHRPDTAVLHILRHPGGMLNSWRRRLLNVHQEEVVLAASRERLKTIATADPLWADRFGAIDTLSVEDLELWFWRYATETVEAAGNGQPQYMRILYEDMVTRTIDIARQVYRICDLTWTDAIETSVHASTADSSSIAAAWRSKLNGQDQARVAAVVDDPPYCNWWKSHD